jgi:hypothetical protein
MTVRVLKGSKQEIVEKLAKLEGEVKEAIVFIEGAPASDGSPPAPPIPRTVEEFLAEMNPYMSQAGDFDDSREAIYERQEGE